MIWLGPALLHCLKISWLPDLTVGFLICFRALVFAVACDQNPVIDEIAYVKNQRNPFSYLGDFPLVLS